MSSISRQPQLSTSQAVDAFRDLYRLEPTTIRLLPGERDQNFLLQLSDERQFVFKVSNPDDTTEVLTAQVNAINRLQSLEFVPAILATKDGEQLVTSSIGSHKFMVRVVSYLPGTPLAEQRRPSASLLADLGRKLAAVDLALMDFESPILDREFDWNLRSGLRVVNEHIQHVSDQPTKKLVAELASRIERSIESKKEDLRQTVIHNDANDYNVIVSNDRDENGERYVAGLIDFGDMAKSYLVGELAIALAYIACRRSDPLKAACELVGAYHQVLPLNEVELACIWDFVLLRLCVSVCMSAQQQAHRPDDEYLSISQEPIRRTLPVLSELSPTFVEATLRAACDMVPSPKSARVAKWLSNQRDELLPVMGVGLDERNCEVVDLSVASRRSSVFASSNVAAMAHARRAPIETDKPFAIGRYAEPRLIYSASAYGIQGERAEGHETAERRSIHLGVDVFAPAGTEVYVPFGGVVHCCEIRKQDQDYGGVIILRHETSNGEDFYTLYGHLSHSSVERVTVGLSVLAGASIGQLGTSEENGGWMPHLHLQVVTDLMGLGDEFPGVAAASEKTVWSSFAPNPVELLGIDDSLREQCQAPGYSDLHKHRLRCVSPNLSLAYRSPLHMVRGRMQYLFDANGRRYLDAFNNVPHVGHCHPRVVEAASGQMETLNTNTRYLHPLLNDYAGRLMDKMPEELEVCFFVNSASEANELAIRLARNATGRQGIVVQEAAYHGNTTTLIDISPYKHDGPGGSGPPEWVHKVVVPDRYRGKCRGDDAGRLYGNEAAESIRRAALGKYPPAAFIAETLPSVGGQIVPPSDYYAIVYEAVRNAGGVTIADEVQTGFGRLGACFWAFEDYDVVPDIVVMGKPMGNGHPVAAVVTTRKISDAFNNGMEYFSTFGGNTVSCAVGLAVLDVIADEGLQERAQETGKVLRAGFLDLAAEFSLVGDVRGSGLFWGLELVRDPVTLEPADVEATLVANRLRDQSILIGTDGPLHNVLKIRPPMQFNADNAEYLIAALREVLQTEL